MAKIATTLANAISASEWIVGLTSIAGLRPNDYLVCEQESMRVLVIGPVVGPSAPVTVYRGARGTAGRAHARGMTATYGMPFDYGTGTGVV